MKQKMTIVMAAFVFICSFSQAQKRGHINFGELFMAMPETKKAEEKFQKYQDSLNNSLGEMYKEFAEKDSVIRADSAKWTNAKKDIKFREFQDLRDALQNYQGNMQQILQQKQQEMTEPIQRIAREAVQAVAKANGYDYVFSSEALLVAPPADDILPLVKKYLKIADKPTNGIK